MDETFSAIFASAFCLRVAPQQPTDHVAPWQGDRAQAFQIDLRIPPRGLRAAMPQHLADLRQRQALPQHVHGKRMTQLMRPGDLQFDPGAVDRAVDDLADVAVRA